MDTLKVYKKTTSMWMKYKEAEIYVDGESRGRDACIFLSLTPSSGGRTYSKDDSISLALGYWDITMIMDGMDRGFLDNGGVKNRESGVSIVHNYDGQIKTLRIGLGEPDRSARPTYGWYLKVGEESYTIFTTEVETYGGRNARLGIYGYLLECSHRMLTT